MIDWESTDFRKLYENPPPEFVQLPFAVRAMSAEILRHCDRRGRIIPARQFDPDLVRRVHFHVRAHAGEEEFIEAGLRALLTDDPDPEKTYLVFRDGYLTIRNFAKAQRSSGAIRMANKRVRDSYGELVDEDSDASYACAHTTSRDGTCAQCKASGLVWSGLSDLSSGDQGSERNDDPGTPEARAIARPRRARWRRAPKDWEPKDAHRALAAELGIDFDLELGKFRDHEFAAPKSDPDATFRNWLRNAKPVGGGGRGQGPRQPTSGYSPSAHARRLP